MEEITEVRWHGRAGQGLITAVELLAEAALAENRYFQAFPEFGAERTGAPMRAFSRFSSHPITLHCPIIEPDGVVVLDPTLLGVVDVFDGLKPRGFAVINTHLAPETLKKRHDLHGVHVFTLNATKIAMDALGRNIPNVPMIGALLRARRIVQKDRMADLLRRRLGSRVSKEAVEGNVAALEKGYVEVQEG